MDYMFGREKSQLAESDDVFVDVAPLVDSSKVTTARLCFAERNVLLPYSQSIDLWSSCTNFYGCFFRSYVQGGESGDTEFELRFQSAAHID